MKKKELIISVLGFILVVFIITPSTMSSIQYEENIFEETREDFLNVPTNRSTFIGKVWTINQEKSFGTADLNIKDDVNINWETHTNSFGKEETSGYLQMMFANFFTNRSGQQFSNYRLSTYKMKVYDGPSIEDNILFEQEKEILENAGDWIENLQFPIKIESNGQPVRDIAVECIAESKLISKFLKTPLTGEHSIKSGLCKLHVNFGSQENFYHDNSTTVKKSFNRSKVNLDLGNIKLLPSNRSDEVTIKTPIMLDYELTLNRSESPYEFFVNVGYGISLNRSPTPDLLSRILGSKTEFILEGSAYNRTTNRTKSLISDSQIIILNEESLNRSESFNRSFILKGMPSELVFTISCDISYDKINMWKLSLPGESFFDSELIRVKLNYI